MFMQEKDMTIFLQSRRALLGRIEKAPINSARRLWQEHRKDGAATGAFASRHYLTLDDYEALLALNDWYVNITLCRNSSFPPLLLRRLAGLNSTDKVSPSCHTEDSIELIARAVLRRRSLLKTPTAR